MRIMLIVFLVAAAVPALASDSPEAWLIPFAATYQPPVRGFNSAFASHGMPESTSRHYGWGLEFRTLTGSFLVGPLFFKTWDDEDNGSYHLRTDVTGIFGEAGLKIAPASFLTIVPMIGVGGLSQSFDMRQKTDSVVFDSLFGSVPENLSFTTGMRITGMAALELGLSVNTGAGRIGIALRGGYLYSPFNPNWHLSNGTRVTDAPGDKLGGLFFSVGLLLLPAAQATTSTTAE
jgi:hypothetical protein